MVQIILQELLTAIGRFFINPLLYVAIVFSIVLGYRRVKRERKFFHIRIEHGWLELKSVFKVGLLASIVLSIVMIAAGLTLPTAYLVIVTIFSIMALIIYNFHLLSPIVIGALSLGALLYLKAENKVVTIFNHSFIGVPVETDAAITITVVTGLLLIMEGLLIAKDGAKFSSPVVEKTNRGLNSIAYFSKKLWVVPVLFVVPGNVIDGFFPWWPMLSIGSEQFALVLFPVVIGFQQVTRRLLPKQFYPKLGSYVQLLGLVVIIGGAVSYFNYIIAYIVMILALIIRFILSIGYNLSEHKDIYAVAPSNKGVVIAAVLPGSPAEKMGLNVGEIIKRVNGKDVSSERELYEALQINAAHCRLEVLDLNDEIRLTQYVVHNNDHYQIGLLLVQ